VASLVEEMKVLKLKNEIEKKQAQSIKNVGLLKVFHPERLTEPKKDAKRAKPKDSLRF
jgi:hypothetical protein